MTTVVDLLRLLGRRCAFELPDARTPEAYVQETPNQIRIMGRIRSDGTTAAMSHWRLIMHALLTRAGTPGVAWKADLSKSYFPRGPKMVFAWRILLQGENIAGSLQEIGQVISGVPQAANVEVTEIALPGVGRANRNVGVNGKGAGLMGSAMVGPAALAASRRQGGG